MTTTPYFPSDVTKNGHKVETNLTNGVFDSGKIQGRTGEIISDRIQCSSISELGKQAENRRYRTASIFGKRSRISLSLSRRKTRRCNGRSNRNGMQSIIGGIS